MLNEEGVAFVEELLRRDLLGIGCTRGLGEDEGDEERADADPMHQKVRWAKGSALAVGRGVVRAVAIGAVGRVVVVGCALVTAIGGVAGVALAVAGASSIVFGGAATLRT